MFDYLAPISELKNLSQGCHSIILYYKLGVQCTCSYIIIEMLNICMQKFCKAQVYDYGIFVPDSYKKIWHNNYSKGDSGVSFLSSITHVFSILASNPFLSWLSSDALLSSVTRQPLETSQTSCTCRSWQPWSTLLTLQIKRRIFCDFSSIIW